MRGKFISVSMLILLSAIGGFAQNRGPAATVAAFYKYSNSRSSTFDRRHFDSRKHWYTQDLYKAFLTQWQKDKAYLKKHPGNKPFFGDGLDFKPLNESCEVNGKQFYRRTLIGRTQVKGNRAYVTVTFAYPKGCAYEPIVWGFELHKVGMKWLIADQIYEDGSTLTKDMREYKYQN